MLGNAAKASRQMLNTGDAPSLDPLCTSVRRSDCLQESHFNSLTSKWTVAKDNGRSAHPWGILLLTWVIAVLVSGDTLFLRSASLKAVQFAVQPEARGSARIRAETLAFPAPVVRDAPMRRSPEWLIVTQTHPGSTPKQGSADIGVGPNATKVYGAGSLLANKARLTEIYDDRVILERDGFRSILYVMSKQPAEFRLSAPSLALVDHDKPQSVASADSRDDLSEVIRTAPVFVENEFRGLVVYPGRRSEDYSQLGFRPGDVITAINGRAVESAVQGLVALRSLISGRTLTLTVERNGGPSTMQVDASAVDFSNHTSTEN
jgi:hypothetical protein